jgi:putative nucleotidyltransferase with HDIG domain
MAHIQRLSSWGRVYVTAVVALGGASIAYSAYQLHARPIGWNWFVLALFTLLSGSATVKLASVPATISISETFVFTSVLLFGPAAGTLTVTLDALAISLWLARRGHPSYRIAFNVFAVPVSLWIGSQLFYSLSHIEPLALTPDAVRMSDLLIPLLVFTIVYFLLNSWLIAVAIAFERGTSAATIWSQNFAWLSLNYFGGASVAALLVTYARNFDYAYIAFAIPLLAVLYFTFSMAMGRVEDANTHLSQLNSLYMSTIETLAMAIDAKDQITHGHIRRVQSYAVDLAKELGVTEQAQISAIEAASLLHDMGKLAVPEYILNKPGPLSNAEFEKMKMHSTVGADILSAIDFPYPVVPIVRHHHENWDGSGYPVGLAGTDIPIGARILSVVDCFDALTSDRPYRPRLTVRDALKILMERRGTMYDPLVVDTFTRVYAHIVPSDRPSTVATSLRAITDATGPTLEPNISNSSFEEISASTDEMLTLFDLAKSLSPSMHLADIADIISKHVRRLIPCSLSVFYIFDSAADELVASHISGEPGGLITGLRIPRGQRLSGWVAANRQTIRNSDPVLDFGESARAMSPRPRSCLSTPLFDKTELVGVLSLYSTNRESFSVDHERVIEIVARQVGPVLAHAAEFQSVKATSLRDHITGLPNIEQFLQFSRSADSASISSTPGSLFLIEIRDARVLGAEPEFGQRDISLSQIVDAIRRVLRPTDMLFRDEDNKFVAVLLHTTEDVSSVLAMRLADVIRSSRFGGVHEISAAIGSAVLPRDGRNFEALLRVAKSRLATTEPRSQGEPPAIEFTNRMDQNTQTLVRAGRFREALGDVNSLPMAVRRTPEVQIVESELLVETGDIESGFTSASKVLDRASDVGHKARALRVMCQVDFYRGKAEESRRAIKKAIDIAHTIRKADPFLYASVVLVRWRLFSKVGHFGVPPGDFDDLKKAVLASGSRTPN